MTTVAYRDGVMAADTGVMDSSGCRYAHVKKIHRCPNGSLVAGAGDMPSVHAIFAWYDRDCPVDELPNIPADDARDVSILIVKPDDTVFYTEKDLQELPIEGEFFAIGSGREGALCAMAAGATAEHAVRIASRFDIYTNELVISERLNR